MVFPMDDTSATASSADAPASTSEDLLLEGLTIKDHKELVDQDDSSIQAVTSEDTPYTSASEFEDLKLTEELLKGLYVEMRFERPSKIQAITLPMIITPPYKNLVAQAHNGSGKTTCFILGMLISVDPTNRCPRRFVSVPPASWRFRTWTC